MVTRASRRLTGTTMLAVEVLDGVAIHEAADLIAHEQVRARSGRPEMPAAFTVPERCRRTSWPVATAAMSDRSPWSSHRRRRGCAPALSPTSVRLPAIPPCGAKASATRSSIGCSTGPTSTARNGLSRLRLAQPAVAALLARTGLQANWLSGPAAGRPVSHGPSRAKRMSVCPRMPITARRFDPVPNERRIEIRKPSPTPGPTGRRCEGASGTLRRTDPEHRDRSDTHVSVGGIGVRRGRRRLND